LKVVVDISFLKKYLCLYLFVAKTEKERKAHMVSNQYILMPRVPEEIYTDRADLLEYYYKTALETANRKSMSAVLLGQRRMGKTEIFKRVVNKLFFEQDHNDPNAVIPVYYSFPDTIKDEISFVKAYISNFIKFYAAFYLNDPTIPQGNYSENDIIEMFKKVDLMRPSRASGTLTLLQKPELFPIPILDAFKLPRTISDLDNISIVVFLDEFQNTRLPQYDFNVSGYFHEAADSITCPHFVTGSAMSILSTEIISRGSLFGRFEYDYIEGMSNYHASELVFKLSKSYQTNIAEYMAPVIAERCGGNPFYITAVIKQSAKSKKAILDVEMLDNILAVDITSGFIWGELSDQVNRWIERINDFQITKWILYLASMDENLTSKRGEIMVSNVQEMLKDRDNIDVDTSKIREVLISLSRGDLLDYSAGSFYRIKDPILNDFLKIWGKIELEKVERKTLKIDLRRQYYHLSKRSLDEYKGYLGEIHMSQVLLAAKGKTLLGKFFNYHSDITIPDFSYVRHRVRLSSGKGKEIDVLGADFPESWVCQSKWLESEKVGVIALEELLAQAKIVQENIQPIDLKKWIFAHNGLTKNAEIFAKENDILWSTRKELDALLKEINLRSLYSFQ
jgi:hypothetical protein